MKSLSDKNLDHLRSIVTEPDFRGTKYRLIKELAHGGMGTIYLAEDPDLGRQIAIKVLNATELDSALARRMVREAKIIARLEHPGIVPVHDVGELADGRVFYAMKLVRGERLDEYAARTTSMKDRLRKFQAACDAVGFAHAHGVIHRDLKPQNIMIGSFGEVLVLDWGVAKIIGSGAGTEASANAETLPLPGSRRKVLGKENDDDTSQGTIIGTVGYMSPEQARGEIEQLDERSDVFSLGAILYYLLTCRAPGLAKPRSLNGEVSKTAEAVCLKAMSPNSADRYSSSADLAADVARLLDDEPVTAYRENWFEKTRRWIGKNRFLILIVLAYLLMRIFFILTSRR